MGKKMLIKELHEVIGLSEWNIRQRAKTGKIPVIKSGNRYVFDQELVEDYLKAEAMKNIRQEDENTNKYGVLRKIEG